MHLFERLVTLLDHQLQKVVQQQCAHPRVVQLHFGTLLAQLFLNAPQRIQRQLSVWKAGASDKTKRKLAKFLLCHWAESLFVKNLFVKELWKFWTGFVQINPVLIASGVLSKHCTLSASSLMCRKFKKYFLLFLETRNCPQMSQCALHQ